MKSIVSRTMAEWLWMLIAFHRRRSSFVVRRSSLSSSPIVVNVVIIVVPHWRSRFFTPSASCFANQWIKLCNPSLAGCCFCELGRGHHCRLSNGDDVVQLLVARWPAAVTTPPQMMLMWRALIVCASLEQWNHFYLRMFHRDLVGC